MTQLTKFFTFLQYLLSRKPIIAWNVVKSERNTFFPIIVNISPNSPDEEINMKYYETRVICFSLIYFILNNYVVKHFGYYLFILIHTFGINILTQINPYQRETYFLNE